MHFIDIFWYKFTRESVKSGLFCFIEINTIFVSLLHNFQMGTALLRGCFS